ncbi:MAG: hypothetical protein GF344_05545 [Chitinivibrionales bacterium]|nr:hypothetical protein [Chitinivibrionales bacterium]MBD3356433.1 hypothetical protein [Chitinivibrionales bacterium]
MPRKARIEIPGEVHHVMARGLDGMEIFRCDENRRWLIHLLERYLAFFDNRCYAWALLPNHYHLLVRISAPNLGLMMRRLNGAYAKRFNMSHGRRGYLFMNRYKSVAVQSRRYFKELVAYIHLNPIRAGIVESLQQLAWYPWCSHTDYLGKSRHSWLSHEEGLKYFESSHAEFHQSYFAFLEEKLEYEADETLRMDDVDGFPAVDNRVVGDEEFVRTAMEKEKAFRDHRNALRKRELGVEDIAKRVAAALGVDSSLMRRESRRGPLAKARALTAYLARRELSAPLREIAEYLCLSVPATSLAASRGARLVAEHDFDADI